MSDLLPVENSSKCAFLEAEKRRKKLDTHLFRHGKSNPKLPPNAAQEMACKEMGCRTPCPIYCPVGNTSECAFLKAKMYRKKVVQTQLFGHRESNPELPLNAVEKRM
jgi:transposase